MPRYLMRVIYDGSAFHGWQTQLAKRSVQQDLGAALLCIGADNSDVTGSGRTDSGVHALAQYAHFDFQGKMTPRQILLGLNTHLDYDVRVSGVWRVADDFHARFQACSRSYIYLLARERTPFNRLYTGFMPHKRLAVETMQALAGTLLGRQDFSSLSKDNPDIPNHVCDLSQLDIEDCGDHIRFIITADRFLHNMVRRIVGTLVNLAHSGWGADTLLQILAEQNPRQKLVITAPAQGLYLAEVQYPDLQLDETSP